MENEISRGGRQIQTPNPNENSREQREQKEQKQKSDDPSFVLRHFIQAGENYYYRNEPEKLAFSVYKDSFRIHHVSESVAAGAVEMAISRGWKEIEVTGTPQFRKLVWTTATARGISVQGYKPSPGEKSLFEPQGVEDQGLDSSLRANTRTSGRAREDAPKPKEKPLSGELIDFGPAHYMNNSDNNMSFYVKLKARDDSEATHWGVDLERAKEVSRAQIGDQVQLARRNSNSDNSNRVTWSVRVLGRSRAKIEETAPAKITEDFAEKRLPHWSPEERASFKEKTNRLRSAIGSNEPERSR